MPASVVGSTATGTTGTGTTANHTITTPVCTTGDLLVASMTLNGGHGTVTEAVGWTRLFPASITDDGFMTLLVYYKVATSGDAVGGVTHTWTSGTAVRSDRGCAAITGQHASPIDSTASEIASAAGQSTDITTLTGNCVVLSFLAIDSATENATPTTPLTELWDPAGSGTNTGQVNAAATALQAVAGTATYAWTWTNALNHKHFLVGIASATGTAHTATATLAITAGQAATGRLNAVGGATLPALAAMPATGRLGAQQPASPLPVAAAIAATGRAGARTGAALAAAVTITATATAEAPYIPALHSIDGSGAAYLSLGDGAATAGTVEGASIAAGAPG